jgi:hypothetical protein
MSEIEPKQQDLQEPAKESEIIPLVTLDSEACENQLSSQELELNTTEITIDKNAYLPIQISNSEAEGVDRLADNFSHQDSLEVALTESSQASIQTQLEASTVTVDDSATPQRVENSSSQQLPLTLEIIYNELIFLGKNVQKLQASFDSQQEFMEKLQISIDFLKEEVTVLKPQKVATNSTKISVEQKRKPGQTTNSNQKKHENKQTKGKKLDFNAVTYLQEHGDDKLEEELKKKANIELTQITRSAGIQRGRDPKTFEREDMIKEIILNAKRRLKQGSAFLKD